MRAAKTPKNLQKGTQKTTWQKSGRRRGGISGPGPLCHLCCTGTPLPGAHLHKGALSARPSSQSQHLLWPMGRLQASQTEARNAQHDWASASAQDATRGGAALRRGPRGDRCIPVPTHRPGDARPEAEPPTELTPRCVMRT